MLKKDKLNLSVNNANSGDGKESLNVKFVISIQILIVELVTYHR